MNPFTKFLGKKIKNQSFKKLIAHWDCIETLVIKIYRCEGSFPQDSINWKQNRAWLQKHYSRWKPELEPYWKGTTAGGKPVLKDPFLAVLEFCDACQLVNNWKVLQTLPAAREAINKYLKEIYPLGSK
jgi:hypothetical protein